ncbi:extracellular solute-binding protein [Scardovia wiggsiae]|uniref:extracellular solute-binding protein n=1 Tax=Scardovia wiggsiae TaxID=230143 RepID=UPI0036182B8C
MKKLTKVMSIAAAGAVLFGMSACGNSNNGGGSNDSNVTLTVWGPSEDQAKSDSWLQTMEKNFEKANPNTKFTWKNAVVSEGDAGKKVKTDAKAAADVYMFANDQLGTLKESNAISELSDDAAKQVKEQNSDSVIESVTGSDGKLYGVPFTGNTWFMYYNKSKFTSDDIKSLDTMLQKGKVTFPVSNSWYFPAFYMGNGGTMFGAKGTDAKAGVNFPDAAAVTAYLAKLVANPNFSDDADGSGIAAVKAGKADVFFSGTWDASNAKEALGDNYAAAPAPSYTLNGKSVQIKPFSGSKAIASNPNSKNPKWASKFAAYLGSKEAQKAHYTMSNVVPSDKTLADQADIKSDPAAIAQIETIEKYSVNQPTISAMNNFWEPATTFGKALSGKTVTESNAEAQTTSWLNSYKK